MLRFDEVGYFSDLSIRCSLLSELISRITQTWISCVSFILQMRNAFKFRSLSLSASAARADRPHISTLPFIGRCKHGQCAHVNAHAHTRAATVSRNSFSKRPSVLICAPLIIITTTKRHMWALDYCSLTMPCSQTKRTSSMHRCMTIKQVVL